MSDCENLHEDEDSNKVSSDNWKVVIKLRISLSDTIKSSEKFENKTYQDLYDNCIESFDVTWNKLFLESNLNYTKWWPNFLHWADTLCPIIKWIHDANFLKSWQYISTIHDIRRLKTCESQLDFLISKEEIKSKNEDIVMTGCIENNIWEKYFIAWYETSRGIPSNTIEKNPIWNDMYLHNATTQSFNNYSRDFEIETIDLDGKEWMKISWFLDILNNLVVLDDQIFQAILAKTMKNFIHSRIIWWYNTLKIPSDLNELDNSKVTITLWEVKETKGFNRLCFVTVEFTTDEWNTYWWNLVVWV